MGFGGLLILVSQYLPWWQLPASHFATFDSGGPTTVGLLDLFSGSSASDIDGWAGGGSSAALVALIVMGLALAAWFRPAVAARLPLGQASMLLAYLCLAVGARTRGLARWDDHALNVHYRLAYGAFLGAGGIALTLAGAAGRLRRPPLVAIPAAAVLASILLPSASYQHLVTYGIALPPLLIAAALAIHTTACDGRERLLTAAGAAVFVGGGVDEVLFGRSYGLWAGVGTAAALVVVSATELRRERLSLSVPNVLATVAGCAFTAGLFLPWTVYCEPRGIPGDTFSGDCFSAGNWDFSGSVVALLGLAVLASVWRPGTVSLSLCLGFALLAGLEVGYSVDWDHLGSDLRLRYGVAAVAAGCVALLVVVLPAHLKRERPGAGRVIPALLPAAACLGFVALLVVRWPRGYRQFVVAGWLSWLGTAFALVALHLAVTWFRRAAGISVATWLLPALPVAMLSFLAVEFGLGQIFVAGYSICLCICAFLLLAAWVEHAVRTERPIVPEMLRVDRL